MDTSCSSIIRGFRNGITSSSHFGVVSVSVFTCFILVSAYLIRSYFSSFLQFLSFYFETSRVVNCFIVFYCSGSSVGFFAGVWGRMFSL